MKERRRDPEKVRSLEEIERFVAGAEGAPPPPAATPPASEPEPAPASPPVTTRSRSAEEGKIRATFDIPRDLHAALKEEAARRSTAQDRFVSMRELVEQMLRERLAQG